MVLGAFSHLSDVLSRFSAPFLVALSSIMAKSSGRHASGKLCLEWEWEWDGSQTDRGNKNTCLLSSRVGKKRGGGNVWTFLRSLATDAADMTRLVHADKSKEMMQKRFVEQPSQWLNFFGYYCIILKIENIMRNYADSKNSLQAGIKSWKYIGDHKLILPSVGSFVYYLLTTWSSRLRKISAKNKTFIWIYVEIRGAFPPQTVQRQ